MKHPPPFPANMIEQTKKQNKKGSKAILSVASTKLLIKTLNGQLEAWQPSARASLLLGEGLDWASVFIHWHMQGLSRLLHLTLLDKAAANSKGHKHSPPPYRIKFTNPALTSSQSHTGNANGSATGKQACAPVCAECQLISTVSLMLAKVVEIPVDDLPKLLRQSQTTRLEKKTWSQ